MITLEKLMTELKAESLNEIVAGHNGKGHGMGGKKGKGHGKGGKKGHGGGTTTDTHGTMTTMSTMSMSNS